MTITMTRDALLEKLKTQLEIAKKNDAKVERLHRQEEQKALAKFREELRTALKWDYQTAKKHGHRLSLSSLSCPRRMETRFASAIHFVTHDMRKRSWSIREDSDIGRLLTWEPEPAPVSVCD